MMRRKEMGAKYTEVKCYICGMSIWEENLEDARKIRFLHVKYEHPDERERRLREPYKNTR